MALDLQALAQDMVNTVDPSVFESVSGMPAPISGGEQLPYQARQPLDLQVLAQQMVAENPEEIKDYISRSSALEAGYRSPQTGEMTRFDPDFIQEMRRRRLTSATRGLVGSSAVEAFKAETIGAVGFLAMAGDYITRLSPTHVLASTLQGKDPIGDRPIQGKAWVESYMQSFDKATEAEAEFAVAAEKILDTSDTAGVAIGGAVNLGANLAATAVNPVGKVARIAGAGIGLATKGAIWGGSALIGSKLYRTLMKGAAKGDDKALKAIAKVGNKLDDIGRGGEPAVGIGRKFQEAMIIERRKAVQRGVPTGDITNMPTVSDLTNKMVLDAKALLGKAAGKGKTPAIQRIPGVTAQDTKRLVDAVIVDERNVAKLKPGQSVELKAHAIAKKLVEKNDPLKVEPQTVFGTQGMQSVAMAKKLEAAARHMDAMSESVEKGLKEGATEANRMVKGAADDVVPKRRIPHPDTTIGKFTRTEQAARRVAANFTANQQMHSLEAGAKVTKIVTDVPDKAVRQDMIALMEGTGNPWKGAEDTLENVQERIAASPHGEKALEWARELRQNYDDMFKDFQEMRLLIGEDELSYKEFWVHHMWADGPEKSKQAFNRNKRFQRATEASFEKRRQIPTYFDGMHEAGLTPRTDDIAELSLHIENMAARARATKKLVREIHDGAVTSDGTIALMRIKSTGKIPDGYQEFRSAFSNRILADSGPTKGTRLVMHNDFYKHIKNIIEQPTEDGSFYRLSQGVKRSNFLFSGFHGFTLMESAHAAFGSLTRKAESGVVGGAAEMVGNVAVGPARRAGRGAVDALRVAGYTDEAMAQHLLGSDSMKQAADLGSYYTLKLDTPVDVGKGLDAAIESGVQKLRHKDGRPISKAAAKTIESLLDFQKGIDRGLWTRMHTPMKVVAFDNLYHNLKGIRDGHIKGILPDKLAKRFGQRRILRDMDDDALGYAVATFVNDEFGAQNFATMTGNVVERWISDPAVLRRMNESFLSLDWNVSAVKASFAALQIIPGTPISNPARGILGLRHWRNAAVGVMIYGNLVNEVMSGKPMWKNEKGRQFLHVDTGERDEDNRPLYWSLGKQFKEVFNLFGGADGIPVQDFLSRKLMPHLRVVAAASGQGFDYARFRTQMMKEGKELGYDDRLMKVLGETLDSIAPIGASQQFGGALEGVPFTTPSALKVRAGAAFVPVSKGITRSRIITQMAEAFRDGDMQRLDALIINFQDRGADEVQEMVEAGRKMADEFPTKGEPEPDPNAEVNKLLRRRAFD